jgi:hypothetical protein
VNAFDELDGRYVTRAEPVEPTQVWGQYPLLAADDVAY